MERLLHRPSRRLGWACAAGLGVWAPEAQPKAQTTTATAINPFRTVNVNYVYSADLGFGGYSLNGLRADVYTLPFAVPLRNVHGEGWTLRFLLPVQVGLYSFRATDTDGRRISINQQSVSVVPGAELQIPLTDRFVVKPFAQAGFSYGFGQDIGNPNSWIYLAGARSVAQWQAGAYTLSLGNAAVFAGDRTAGPGFQENYVSLQVGGEVRRPSASASATGSRILGSTSPTTTIRSRWSSRASWSRRCASPTRTKSAFPLVRRSR